MLKNCGAIFALLAMIGLGTVAGYQLSTEPFCYQTDQTHPKCTNKKPREDDQLYLFWKWSTHDPVAFFTFMLAIFTGALVAVSSIQIRFLIRADETARKSADAATIAAEAAKAQSDIADKQVALTARQTDITEKQHGVVRLQFIATHRPRLRVRNIVIVPPAAYDRLLFSGLHTIGRCYVENTGGMTATVTQSHLQLYANQMGLPMAAPYEDEPANGIISGAFNIGESRVFEFTQLSPLAGEEADRVRRGAHPFFVLGWIHYRDDSERGVVSGVAYRLAFCRQWNAGLRRFVRIEDDPDYEYEG